MEEAGQNRNDIGSHEYTYLQQRYGLLHCTPIIHLRLWNDTLELQSLYGETCRLRAKQLGRIAHFSRRGSCDSEMRYPIKGDSNQVIETGLIQREV